LEDVGITELGDADGFHEGKVREFREDSMGRELEEWIGGEFYRCAGSGT
jgi:hypothetical protein